jgi:hypothetical protein
MLLKNDTHKDGNMLYLLNAPREERIKATAAELNDVHVEMIKSQSRCIISEVENALSYIEGLKDPVDAWCLEEFPDTKVDAELLLSDLDIVISSLLRSLWIAHEISKDIWGEHTDNLNGRTLKPTTREQRRTNRIDKAFTVLEEELGE